MLERFVKAESFGLHISKPKKIPGNIFFDISKVRKSTRRGLLGRQNCILLRSARPPTHLHAPYFYAPCTLAPCSASAMRMLTPWVGPHPPNPTPRDPPQAPQGWGWGRGGRGEGGKGPFGPLGPLRFYAPKAIPNNEISKISKGGKDRLQLPRLVPHSWRASEPSMHYRSGA